MAKNRKTPDMNLPIWFDGQNINEALFCEEFLRERRIIFANGAFFTPDGRVTDDLPLRGEIYEKLKFCAVNNIPRKITNILEVLKLEAQVPDFTPEQDRIHVFNGTLLLEGTFAEGRPAIVRSRLPVAYNPNAPAPVIWLNFLDDLLYPEDIPTFQEFIGYCLIPSNKGQRMMVIKGNGGEGKSQIGAVLGSIFGTNMKDGSIGKISENRFARADLEHILLCVDDDMRMEALRQTNYVKSIVTAQGKMDLERKGKQSYQGWMFARLLAFSNGDLQALYDRSDGFYRRQLMIADCEAGRIDMIITKSISRFARNTVDCLKYTRKLKELNIAVFFEKENINTLDAKGEVLMTIMAALAQQESESLSANVRLGIQFRNQQGKVQINHNWFLGYTKDESGKLVIVPEEAEVVRRIYREYLEGASFVKIRRGLEADGILNGAKHARWHETNIKQILTNEKYIGDALLQKTYTVSVLDKKRSVNDGAMPKYYVEGCHEAIIDRETFLLVQEEIARRSSLYKGGKKRMYSSKYALSGNVVCGHCGNIYRRVVWSVGNEKPVVWRCVSRLTTGQECSARTVPEEELHAAIASAVNMAYGNRDDIIPVLKENIESVVGCDADEEIEVIDNMIRKSQMDLLDAGRDEARVQEIGERIVSLRERRQNVLTQAALRKDEIDRIKAMITFIEEQTGEAEYSEILVRRMIEKVTIHDDRITVEFKSGLAIDVDA